MTESYLGQTTDILLGQEFLTWLWFRSDTAPDAFRDAGGLPFAVSMEQRIVVQGGEGEARETATVSGAFSPLREARLGLATGKQVTRALLRLEKDGLAWQLTLKAEDFSLGSLKTPKVEKDSEDDEPDAAFLEKIYLIESCTDLLDGLFREFLTLRLSPAWTKEALAVRRWILEAAGNGAPRADEDKPF